ncbi:MAG: anhydro-N-acetylmuramic acid kinase [Xanthomonadales bacterium]|nr:anhydro-N-acetylmuramic acid kinase [Xanthomonadales bacterium]
MQKPNKYAIGLLSGTSIDGIDAVLADFSSAQPQIVAVHSHPFPEELQAELKQLAVEINGPSLMLTDIMRLHGELSIVFADAVHALLSQNRCPHELIAGIGFHGQTVGHHPEAELPWSLQLGDANRLSLLTGLSVVSGFRSMDIAAGGQGAPLAPLLHREIFQASDTRTAVVNIGGIANLSQADGSGFDTGPGNCLLDAWVLQNKNQNYDPNGSWAASGQANENLITTWLQDPYFQLSPPKSTGTDYFNLNWLAQYTPLDSIPAADIQASLSELTARSIAASLEFSLTSSLDSKRDITIAKLLVCGGGAHNTDLMMRLQNLLPDVQVSTTAVAGVDPDWVEGLLFAWLGWQRLNNQAVDTRKITGAEKPLLLGAIYQAVA